MTVLLRVSALSKLYEIRSLLRRRVTSRVHAVRNVSFEIAAGESVGLVGESGSGKTTTSRCVLAMETPSAGVVEYQGRSIGSLKAAELRWYRREVQAVFQDPKDALSPRFKAVDLIAEPLVVHGTGSKRDRIRTALDAMERVGLDPAERGKRPADFSGGQRQRLAIARALVLDPSFLVLDEPTSALDVSVQAQILNLFRDLQAERGLSYLFISHQLGAVANVCDRVVVIYAGMVMESGTSAELLSEPLHPYTQALLLASDETDVARDQDVLDALSGAVPSTREELSGCPFRSRCVYATDICRHEVPPLSEVAPGRAVACHLVTAAPQHGTRPTPATRRRQ
jgi:oligopeptide/dipeptide ABC transporter ATP-binding protein